MKQETTSTITIKINKVIHWQSQGNGQFKRIDDLFLAIVDDNISNVSFNEQTKQDFLKRLTEEISLRLC
jgi:hypothetical protein